MEIGNQIEEKLKEDLMESKKNELNKIKSVLKAALSKTPSCSSSTSSSTQKHLSKNDKKSLMKLGQKGPIQGCPCAASEQIESESFVFEEESRLKWSDVDSNDWVVYLENSKDFNENLKDLDLVTKYDLKELKEILLESANNEKTGSGSSANVEEPESFILYKHSLSIEEEKLVNKFADKFDAQIITSVTLKVPPTHIIVPGVKFDVTWTVILSVLSGCWIVTSDWVKDSLKEEVPKPASTYELPKDKFPGFSKARLNKVNQLPGLFSGCHFFFGGNFESYAVKNITFRKEDLKALVEKHGGVIVKRSPDPESLALEKTVPFHANVTSSLKETSYFIIYQEDKWDPKPKYNMSHMKTLPVEWLLSCMFKFELLEPTQQGSWCDFL